MTAEKNLWRWLSKASLHYKRKLHMVRVENAVGSGMPDVEGYLRGEGSLLIELKTAKRPIRKDGIVRVKIRDEQEKWHLRRNAAGQATHFLIQVGSGAKAKRYLILGFYVSKLKKGMTEERIASMSFLAPTPRAAIFAAAWSPDDRSAW